jgi:hypothetical protein
VTNKDATRLMARLMAAFPSKDIREATVDAYMDVLCALPLEKAAPAIESLVLTADFFPSIAEIVAAAGVTGDDVRLLAEAIRTKQQLSRDYVKGWVIGEPTYPIPAPETPALPDPNEVRIDIRGTVAALAKALRGGRA